MLTETEAEPAWRSRRVAMNTVDPGYMSAAPECEEAFEGVRPIGWEDGARRVLWPIAVAEIGGEVVKGRFLKHYGAVEVDSAALSYMSSRFLVELWRPNAIQDPMSAFIEIGLYA